MNQQKQKRSHRHHRNATPYRPFRIVLMDGFAHAPEEKAAAKSDLDHQDDQLPGHERRLDHAAPGATS
ncbi:MAG: hypothetical protein AB7F74_19755 [Parvibaculaceae bacterium]